MTCRAGETGRLDKLKRPARLVSAVVGVGLVAVSVQLSDGHLGTDLTLAGVGVLFVALLLPALTEFEIDVFGIHAKASLRRREDSLRAMCLQDARTVASLAALAGVDPDQLTALAEEAIEDTCRLWRGRVVDDLVRAFVMCRAIQLIRVSLRLGGPYRVLAPAQTGGDGSRLTAFATLSPTDRMIIALAEYAAIGEEQIAAMLDLDRSAVATLLSQGRATIEQAAGV
jgi:hypothetical protein